MYTGMYDRIASTSPVEEHAAAPFAVLQHAVIILAHPRGWPNPGWPSQQTERDANNSKTFASTGGQRTRHASLNPWNHCSAAAPGQRRHGYNVATRALPVVVRLRW